MCHGAVQFTVFEELKRAAVRGFQRAVTPDMTYELPTYICLLQQTCHGAVQFTVYEELKHAAARGFGAASTSSDADRPISSFETSVYAATSKLSASIITYPSQVSNICTTVRARHGGNAHLHLL